MKHLYKIYPKTDISGLLPGNKRILDPVEMPLNRKEFIKCMKAGTVCAIVNGKEILIDEMDYDKAESLFGDSLDIVSEISDTDTSENTELKNNGTEHINNYQKSQINQSSSKRRDKRNKRNNN